MIELKINPAFRDLIPPLTKDEYQGLEENLIKNGCLDALKVWNGTILDGHNRYELCKKNSVAFETIDIDVEDEDDAKIWIIKNQFDRRNLNDAQRSMLALEIEPSIAARAKKNQGKRSDILPTLVKGSINTQAEVAKVAQVSKGTIYKVK